ncbi:MAG: carboxypeptidase regulatory-like domain-containing protein [Thermoplasmata archaeon]
MVALVTLVALLGAGFLTSPSTSASTHSGLTAAGRTNPATATSFPTPIQHVFTIVLENAGLTQALSQGPYLSTLYNTYAGASNYYAICHPSAPNYLGMTSGERLQCGSDNVNSYPISNVASLVTSAGESWNAYMESMPSPCYKQFYPAGGDGLYKPGHNPFIYYSDLASGGSNSACDTHDIPLSSFNPADTPANYTFLTPNMLNDGHNTSVAYASSWLAGYLPTLLGEPWASSTVFFIVYDEGENSDTSGYDGLDGGHTYLTAVSPYTLGAGLYSGDASPFSLLTTTEWLLGLGSLGHQDNWTEFPPMKSMFHVSAPPSHYTLSGQVDSASTGQPIAGANVTATEAPTTSTNATGGYSFTLLNGTYQVTASAPGFRTGATSITVNGKAVHHTFELDAASQAQYVLSGNVTFAINGSGVAGALVTVANFSAAITGPNGNYSFDLVNGTYEVSASAPVFETVQDQVTVAGGPATLNFNVTPIPTSGEYSLRGDVAYAANGSGVLGATVALMGGSSVPTSANGSYSFSVPNGTYTMIISQPGSYAQQAVVSVMGSSQVDNFDLYPFLLQIQGAVVSRTDGTPITGANVSLSPTIWQYSGEGGAYVFWVPNGTYILRVGLDGYISTDVALALRGQPVTTDLSLSTSIVPTVTSANSHTAPTSVPGGDWTMVAIGAAAISFSALTGLAWRWRSKARRRAN